MIGPRIQPQGLIRLSRTNKFIPGAIVFPLAAYPASLGMIQGVRTIAAGTTTIRGGALGKGYATTSAATDFIRLGAIPQMTTAAFTALVIVKLNDLSSNPTIFESFSPLTGLGSSNNSFQFRANSNGSLGAVKDNIADLGSSPGGVVVAGRFFVAAISCGSGTMRIAADGKSVYETSMTNTFLDGNFSMMSKDGTTSEKSAGEAVLFSYWPRLMSNADLASLTSMPWQLFDEYDDDELLYVAQAAPVSITPDPANIGITGYAPSLVRGVTTNVSPSPASLAITGYAPSITQTAGRTIYPQQAALAITGYAPTVARGGSQTIPTGVSVPATLQLTGYAPTVIQATPTGLIATVQYRYMPRSKLELVRFA